MSRSPSLTPTKASEWHYPSPLPKLQVDKDARVERVKAQATLSLESINIREQVAKTKAEGFVAIEQVEQATADAERARRAELER